MDFTGLEEVADFAVLPLLVLVLISVAISSVLCLTSPVPLGCSILPIRRPFEFSICPTSAISFLIAAPGQGSSTRSKARLSLSAFVSNLHQQIVDLEMRRMELPIKPGDHPSFLPLLCS
ncbi:hypothetical protein Nepgr_002914 [Nepenthes gracilis]|uniref:Uncharacterized protein n=1 Tax=Nepenthes gracilis TaxID=150966 RepID=A0AAD3P8J7_NEPGR|nr:hypothetical protein Nepgr_002914 [Nepenthes gracilis]